MHVSDGSWEVGDVGIGGLLVGWPELPILRLCLDPKFGLTGRSSRVAGSLWHRAPSAGPKAKILGPEAFTSQMPNDAL